MINKIKNLIDNSKNIAIFFHVNPDGDAIGSAKALKHALNGLNKKAVIFSQDKIEELSFLDCDDFCLNITNEKFDLGFVLDCGEIKRIGTMEAVLKNCKNVVNIDHHLNNENFTEYKIVDTKASSTCEIIYYFLKGLNFEFDEKIKIALYLGLATDSGCFMYNINKNIYSVAKNLSEGIESKIEQMNYELFREKSFGETKLLGVAITKLESYYSGKLAITDILQKDLKEFDVSINYTPSIIFLLSGLKNFDVICVICEEKFGVFRVSFRSNKVDVCALAQKFGGGGHKFASGCKIYGNKNTVKKKILEKVQEYFDERNNKCL